MAERYCPICRETPNGYVCERPLVPSPKGRIKVFASGSQRFEFGLIDECRKWQEEQARRLEAVAAWSSKNEEKVLVGTEI